MLFKILPAVAVTLGTRIVERFVEDRSRIVYVVHTLRDAVLYHDVAFRQFSLILLRSLFDRLELRGHLLDLRGSDHYVIVFSSVIGSSLRLRDGAQNVHGKFKPRVADLFFAVQLSGFFAELFKGLRVFLVLSHASLFHALDEEELVDIAGKIRPDIRILHGSFKSGILFDRVDRRGCLDKCAGRIIGSNFVHRDHLGAERIGIFPESCFGLGRRLEIRHRECRISCFHRVKNVDKGVCHSRLRQEFRRRLVSAHHERQLLRDTFDNQMICPGSNGIRKPASCGASEEHAKIAQEILQLFPGLLRAF